MQGAKLVVDVTYRCNARCRYCKWSVGDTSVSFNRSPVDLCVNPSILQAANISRVVLSGGEPLLYSDIDVVIRHYRSAQIPDIVIITNGLIASLSRLKACVSYGATGFAFSIDSSPNDTIIQCARAMTHKQHEQVFRNLSNARSLVELYGIELTVNCVLSASNCSLESIKQLMYDCAERGVTSIKFQPVFNDGFMEVNAPELRLGSEHASIIRSIGRDSSRWPIVTNPLHFFEEVAKMCEGQTLDSRSCGLNGTTYLLQEGGLVICPWISSTPAKTVNDISRLSRDFCKSIRSCSSGPQCFCLQPRNHSWGFSDGDT